MALRPVVQRLVAVAEHAAKECDRELLCRRLHLGVELETSGAGGFELNAQVKAATKELSVAFFRSVFGDGDKALHNWPERHYGIVARFVASGS